MYDTVIRNMRPGILAREYDSIESLFKEDSFDTFLRDAFDRLYSDRQDHTDYITIQELMNDQDDHTMSFTSYRQQHNV